MKFNFYNQLESNDCGPACLAMVANYHGQHVSLKETKELCSVTRMGVSVKDILEGGKKLGLECTGLKLYTSQLREVPLPLILFWKQDHFVVLYRIKEKRGKLTYYIADPGYGKTVIDAELLEKEWLGNSLKGVALVFQATESSADTRIKGPDQKRYKSYYEKSELFKILIGFIKSNKLQYFTSLLLLLVGLSANWLIPVIFKNIIDNGIIGRSLNLVVILLLAQFFLFIGNFCAKFFSDLILTKFNFKLSIALKANFLEKLVRLPVNYFDTRLNTDTLQRLTDLSKVQSFLTWKGIGFFINILNLVVFSIILFFLSKVIFLVFLVLSLLSVVWVAYFLRRRATVEYSMFIRQSENSNMLYEFIMNMPEIKVNQAQHTLIHRITSLQKKLNELELRSLYLNMYQLSGANFILKLKEILTIAISAYLIINNKMTVGTLLSISYIMGQLSGPIINLINNIHDGQDADIAKRRIDDVYTVKNEEEFVKSNLADIVIDNLRIDNLSFKYPGSFNLPVLKNISFEIPRNKITAIVGTSGSGKTTLMKLLLLYYNPSLGNVLLGDIPLSIIDPNNWRKKCGVVLQDGHIFSGTLLYNITLTEESDVDYESLENAVKIACLEELVTSLPMGYSTKIGNVGMQLSGGQIQRVLIARAVYKNPDIIFFDEATSSLDANTEKTIMNNLQEFFAGRTVVIIAHRLSTVKNADQIIVLEKGEIIEVGSHNELVNRQERYFSLVRNQLELG